MLSFLLHLRQLFLHQLACQCVASVASFVAGVMSRSGNRGRGLGTEWVHNGELGMKDDQLLACSLMISTDFCLQGRCLSK